MWYATHRSNLRLPHLAQLTATIDVFGARIGMSRDELLVHTPATAVRGVRCATSPSDDAKLLFPEYGHHNLTVDFTADGKVWQLRGSCVFSDTPLRIGGRANGAHRPLRKAGRYASRRRPDLAGPRHACGKGRSLCRQHHPVVRRDRATRQPRGSRHARAVGRSGLHADPYRDHGRACRLSRRDRRSSGCPTAACRTCPALKQRRSQAPLNVRAGHVPDPSRIGGVIAVPVDPVRCAVRRPTGKRGRFAFGGTAPSTEA